jgi:hypothetical protein
MPDLVGHPRLYGRGFGPAMSQDHEKALFEKSPAAGAAQKLLLRFAPLSR